MAKLPIINACEYFIEDQIKEFLSKNQYGDGELQTKAIVLALIQTLKDKYDIKGAQPLDPWKLRKWV